MSKPYRGARKGSERNTTGRIGRISESRDAWAIMPKFDLILFYGHSPDYLEWRGEEVTEEMLELPPVRIALRYPGKRTPTTVNLTAMTEKELDVFKEFFDYAVERARPIVQAMDQRAREALENGDPSYARIYRRVPEFFTRERLVEEHRESLPSGPARPPHLAASGSDLGAPPAEGDGDADGDVPDGASGGVGTGDDE